MFALAPVQRRDPHPNSLPQWEREQNRVANSSHNLNRKIFGRTSRVLHFLDLLFRFLRHLIHIQNTLRHLRQGFLTITRHIVERRFDVAERLLKHIHIQLRARRLLVNLDALRLQSLGSACDQLLRSSSDRLHLFEHDLLIRQS